VQQKRFTSLDRIILKRGEETGDNMWLHVSAPQPATN
jgi:hypothetical protein